ncbi:hypothetical protein B0H14DRAFT_3085966 [Mycena olivaceomarginata]|nr:hypothetical protein B0H14DRAFT_3085966 [Mycena olivaceomarginata]
MYGCSKCDKLFPSRRDLKEHLAIGQSEYCQYCDDFCDSEDLEYHCQMDHSYCAECQREHYRQSAFHPLLCRLQEALLVANNLKNHLNSSIHLPKDVLCPARDVDSLYRRTIDRLVRQFDTNNNITKPSRLLQGANERAWNGVAYECYLCHAGYRTLAALNQHLGSPRHQEKVYVCPLNVCRVRFSTLSGLCQHIERGRCGVASYAVLP